MASKGSKSKGSSWFTPTLDDFGLTSPTLSERKPKKRPREAEIFSQCGKKVQQGGTALWVELYAPTTRDDLAVHKKKVQEVENWLVESMAGMKGRRFLLLTGPAGCGKTATIKILAREAGLTAQEWINPTSTSYKSAFMDQENIWISGDTVVPGSQTSQFRDFLIRTSKYRSVCGTGKAGNIILIEDFPNAFLRDPSEFHMMLRQYKASSPVVFIMTDSTNQQSSAKHVFPVNLQQDLSIINIQFNPIASSLLVKALSRIASMESVCSGQPIPPKEALQTLADASGGDVRSAVNALQFAAKKDVYHIQDLFAGGSEKGKSKSSVKAQRKIKGSKASSSKAGDADTENLIAGKDILEDYAASVTVRGLMHANHEEQKGSRWRPLTRPVWYSVAKKSQEHLSALRAEHRMASFTSEELTTVVVPLQAKIYAATRRGHFSLTREIGSFSNIQMNNSSGDQLDEHDANSSVVEDEEPDRGAVNDDTENKDTEVDLLENQEPSDPDEDFRIDEFDD
ncbi:putative cell cycle checkpoint protein RAD17 isoform X2 [Penaeus vannamei]|uniref:Putative cell cycle checkpoint protein RAD17 isoform X2 n=1 Tax=Penaeus vannamei TaxID=6689 RepID=A0A3R7MML4_PENVA|nr:putative cell cycle checkpoint protein RAD17 isoform X2 [Penaeus vannamei]